MFRTTFNKSLDSLLLVSTATVSFLGSDDKILVFKQNERKKEKRFYINLDCDIIKAR